MKKALSIFLGLLILAVRTAPALANAEPCGHALIPDLVADPSLTEIDGTFYCYATTDGAGQGLQTSGPPVVWRLKDFLNWSYQSSNFPDDFDAKYWVPSSLMRTEDFFVRPTAGHAYQLESSLDGKTWPAYGGHEDLIRQSPHVDTKSAVARYFRLTFLKGAPGLWEFRV